MKRIIWPSLLALLSNHQAFPQLHESQPNVLFVIADQLVPMLTGPYGSSLVKTPNMDKLASEGVVFSSAYTSNPLCAPARASMLTGRYTTGIRVYDNAAPLSCDIPTICHSLRNMDYETVLSGKVHFVGADQLHGFSRRLIPSNYPTDFKWVKARDEKIPNSHVRDYVGSAIKPSEDNSNYRFDELAQSEAVKFLNSSDSKDKPFFLMVSYNYPHEPFLPPKKYWDMYKNTEPEIPQFPENWKETLSIMDKWLNRHHGADKIDVTDPESLKTLYRAYYALITYVDDKLGELLNVLEKQGLDKNTVVIFTSDHGDMLGHRGMVQKRVFYDWSTRMSLIIKYPGKIAAGRKVETHVSMTDLVPTLFDLALVPEKFKFMADGTSLLNFIDQEDEERYIFSETHSEGVYTTCFMVRKGKFKYNYFHNHGAQLFNMEDDPMEWKNLSGMQEYIQIESNMKNLIFKHFNPNQIEVDLRESIKNRSLIQPVLEKNKIDWKYSPGNNN